MTLKNEVHIYFLLYLFQIFMLFLMGNTEIEVNYIFVTYTLQVKSVATFL